jgi:hypothetical protein
MRTLDVAHYCTCVIDLSLNMSRRTTTQLASPPPRCYTFQNSVTTSCYTRPWLPPPPQMLRFWKKSLSGRVLFFGFTLKIFRCAAEQMQSIWVAFTPIPKFFAARLNKIQSTWVGQFQNFALRGWTNTVNLSSLARKFLFTREAFK